MFTELAAELTAILQFMFENLLKIWPYLLVTIPIAVAVNLSGASRYINRAFQARPLAAIFLATAVGAFSPFCSCGVIPVIASLLIGGVPLAPVMAFWIASPSMDPEIFFLSVGELGWELAVWRLAGTFVLSLSGGLITHLLVGRGWLGGSLLRERYSTETRGLGQLARQLASSLWGWLRRPAQVWPEKPSLAASAAYAPTAIPLALTGPSTQAAVQAPAAAARSGQGDDETGGCSSGACALRPPTFRQRLLAETWAATWMVVKFMALAFFLEALITLYVPSAWIAGALGNDNPFAILAAALLGVPVYTSNLAALPLVSGLLAQGMSRGAALAFLVAGPTTTLPAMAAVWGLVRPRVFALYVLLSLVGAVILGYVYALA